VGEQAALAHAEFFCQLPDRQCGQPFPSSDFQRSRVSASLKGIHFRRFGVGHSARRRVRNTPMRWLLRKNKQS